MRKNNYKLTVWMSKSEIDQFNLLCEKYQVTKTQMIRTMVNKITPPSTNEGMGEVIAQLRYIGNNLNQLARSANAAGEIDTLAYQQNVDMLYGVVVEIKEAISKPASVIEVVIDHGNH